MNIKFYKLAYQNQKYAKLENKVGYKSTEEINEDIMKRRENGQRVKKVSDGYHTYEEYTEARNAWCINYLTERPDISWKSLRHYDEENDSISNFNDDFVAGINTPKGPVAQHIKMKYWDLLKAPEIDHAPEYDGYTTAESIERINSLLDREPGVENYLGLIKVSDSELLSNTSDDIEEIYKWFAMYPNTNQVLLHNRKELDLMFEKYKDTEVHERRYFELTKTNGALECDCNGKVKKIDK